MRFRIDANICIPYNLESKVAENEWTHKFQIMELRIEMLGYTYDPSSPSTFKNSSKNYTFRL